ncbi:MAG TPA: caspase family protein [Terriglobia bacterium]
MGKNRKSCLLPIAFLLAAILYDAAAALPQTSSSSRGVQDVTSPASTAQPGRYYALVIGNNNYRYLPKLQTAVSDANAMAQLLHDQYGFATQVLQNATRNAILTALNEYRRTLPENSNLLIYYAGHGHHDPDTDKAYWLPVDAQSDNNDNWVSADDITADVKALPSLHVLIISDSCYSGALTRSVDAAINPRERSVYLAKMEKSKSRSLMSSGSDEPVADGGAAGHSVFAGALLDSLRQIDPDEFTAAELFQRFVQPAVAGGSDQLPQYSPIRNSGHAFGDFIFFRQSGSKHDAQIQAASAVEPAGPPPATTSPGQEPAVPTANLSSQAEPSQNVARDEASKSGGSSSSLGAQSPPVTIGQPEQSTAGTLGSSNVQRFPVVHFALATTMDWATDNCSGWMTIENGVLHYRAVKGTHPLHSFDIRLDSIKEVKKNSFMGSAFQAFHIREKGGQNYNFALLDSSLQQVQNPGSLINAIQTAIQGK